MRVIRVPVVKLPSIPFREGVDDGSKLTANPSKLPTTFANRDQPKSNQPLFSDFFFVLPPCFPSTDEEEARTRKAANRKAPDMTSNWKWYTVFRGWDPGVYGTWYECYKQGINFDGFHYAHFDTKEEAIASFDRYNHAATIEREVHDQLTLEEGLAELGEIPPPPLPPRMWIEELYEAKGEPLPRSPSIDEEPRIDLFPRDRTLYQRVGSGYEPVMEPRWSD
ncbi:hypothetical protein Syun_006860 [Stephania yunnanensis]|uniref:Ribonuclease H1 N-terminal domain-containing protein n=1 Tax=Stephania yunnanensis TaxID=152371 RepID=A0AAP0KZ43_9MAGN